MVNDTLTIVCLKSTFVFPVVLKNARFKMTEDNEKLFTINYIRSFLQYILGKLKQKTVQNNCLAGVRNRLG